MPSFTLSCVRFFPRHLLASVLLLGLGYAGSAAADSPSPISIPRFTHPGAGQVYYFLLTDRFANGSPANDHGGLAGGAEINGFDPTRISHYHGGDFAGLTAKLDYLKELGVTAVWVTPPFKNKPMQAGTAGYHGYWITDFLAIDPHLGTNEEYREFIRQAHARGLKVCMDIIVNHTADVIQLSGDYAYRSLADAPYRDATGRPFDIRAAAYNGLGDPAAFPALSIEKSFPYVPTVPPAEARAKNPAWLNEPRYYHNRGNTTFTGENSTQGDFVGLDDVFTEHPRVVQGMIEIFSHWLTEYQVDGFRIDTTRHVNTEFWQAFIPALRARARELGRPDFIQFGEVYNEAGDPALLSEFSTNTLSLDTTLDFGFFAAARRFVSQSGSAAALVDFFARDDYYTDHDSNVHSTTTFLGNHDAGRFAYFLQQDNPAASPAVLADLVKLGHGLLLLARGQPVVYYGDEQGMIGRGGNDMQAREDMFAAHAVDFRNAALLATARTGADDKFDEQHPFYQLIRSLNALRAAHPALRTGAMIPRESGEPGLFAFSRLERGEQIEYLAAFNRSRTASLTTTLPTSQPAGAGLTRLFASDAGQTSPALTVDAAGRVAVTLAPLQFAVWRAQAPLPASPAPLTVTLTSPAPHATLTFTSREVDGLIFPSRQEIRADVHGADDFAEVTFTLTRASRPDQVEWLGTDDTAPYRIFWSPAADLAANDELTFTVTVDDRRGRRAASQVARVRVAAPGVTFGVQGATGPTLTSLPPRTVSLSASQPLTLSVQATGTGPLEYQWLRDDAELAQATQPTLQLAPASAPLAGRYRVLVRNRAGTVLSPETIVTVQAGKD